MLAVDRITERGKKAITDLLAKSIEIEYAFILNYPGLIDQSVNIEPIAQERVAKKLEFLGKESVQHAHWIMRLIEGLGGEPQLPFEVIDRIVDVRNLMLKQLDREKPVRVLFQQARSVAAQNQDKGILAVIRMVDIWSRDMVKERNPHYPCFGAPRN